MPDVTIAICTFGDEMWRELACERALPSAEAQGVPIIQVHGETLQGCRNEALDRCETPWLIYLDSDDELEEGYVEAMLAGRGDVRAPSVRRVTKGRAKKRTYMPRVYNHRHECRGRCLPLGNWVTVGAMSRVDLLKTAGGWGPEPVYEDWSLWLRCWRAGGDIRPCHDAVYRYWFAPTSRNHSLTMEERDSWHWKIYDQVMAA